MRKFTLEQYKQMAESFNKKTFAQKIKLLQENSDILTLASDHNWWAVKAIDKDIQEELYDTGTGFVIENEWDSSEMHDLIGILGLDVTDI